MTVENFENIENTGKPTESMGARLARLRRTQNITQEELSERLGISRQAVSKWELDLAYPETDKLLSLSRLYGCTVDYLLTGETPPNQTSAQAVTDSEMRSTSESLNLWERMEKGWGKRPRYFEYKSRRIVKGIPLVHINIGFGRKARGIIAVGLSARGVLSIGLASVGILSLGLFSVGLLSVGLLSLGLLLAVGSVALGAVAIGAIAVGILAIGALSAGLISIGALALGHYVAVGDYARGLIAIGGSMADGKIFSTTPPNVELWKNALLPEALEAAETHVPGWLREIAKAVLRWVY